jgi:hypothetical protein
MKLRKWKTQQQEKEDNRWERMKNKLQQLKILINYKDKIFREDWKAKNKNISEDKIS